MDTFRVGVMDTVMVRVQDRVGDRETVRARVWNRDMVMVWVWEWVQLWSE